jgi:type IV pilus assembly protein PilA
MLILGHFPREVLRRSHKLRAENRRCFTLIELVIVILIVGILASILIPIMRGRINAAKWSEAKATAGTIRRAVRVLAAEKGIAEAQALTGSLGVAETQTALGFSGTDLIGTYFVPSDYNIDLVNAEGTAQITVTASVVGGPPAGETRTLTVAGEWW